MVRTFSRARRRLLAFAVPVGIAAAAAPTLAHHSRAMFDMAKNITYQGVVEEYRWQNPHSHVVVRVRPGAADPSTVGTWTVEASAIGIMTYLWLDSEHVQAWRSDYGRGSSECGWLSPRVALLRSEG